MNEWVTGYKATEVRKGWLEPVTSEDQKLWSQSKMRSILSIFLLFAVSSSWALAPYSLFTGNGDNPPEKDRQKVNSKNAKANAAYAQAVDYLKKGKPWAGGSVLNAQKALKLFREAEKHDPQFAMAYLGEADALDAVSFSVSGSMEPVDVYRLQEAAARKAVEIDDHLAAAHARLAEVYYDNEYDWANAEKELKRVIELTPNSAAAHTNYGVFLGTMGRFQEAEAQVKLAQAIDDKSAAPNRAMLRILYWERKDDAAVKQGLEALKKDKGLPTHFFLGLVYIHQGQFQKGIEEEKMATGLGDAGTLGALAYAYAMAGDKTNAEKTLERFNQHPAHDHVFYRLAAVYLALGDKDRAVSLINKDYERRGSWVNRLKVDPVMDPLRDNPHFKELMSKLHFNN